MEHIQRYNDEKTRGYFENLDVELHKDEYNEIKNRIQTIISEIQIKDEFPLYLIGITADFTDDDVFYILKTPFSKSGQRLVSLSEVKKIDIFVQLFNVMNKMMYDRFHMDNYVMFHYQMHYNNNNIKHNKTVNRVEENMLKCSNQLSFGNDLRFNGWIVSSIHENKAKVYECLNHLFDCEENKETDVYIKKIISARQKKGELRVMGIMDDGDDGY